MTIALVLEAVYVEDKCDSVIYPKYINPTIPLDKIVSITNNALDSISFTVVSEPMTDYSLANAISSGTNTRTEISPGSLLIVGTDGKVLFLIYSSSDLFDEMTDHIVNKYKLVKFNEDYSMDELIGRGLQFYPTE